MKIYLISFVSAILLTIILGKISIPLLKRLKAGQPILKYVESHKNKSGTPTMGGLFFIPSAIIVYLCFGTFKKLSLVSLAIGLAFLVVGFLDDYLKIKYKENQGLKAYQKIIFQLLISLIAGVFSYINKITVFNLPFSKLSVDLGVFTVPIVALIFIAITNSVNLTDGLDGLSSSTSICYLFFLLLILFLQLDIGLYDYLLGYEIKDLIILIVSLIGSLLGFLIFNVSPACVFMGDTGSLSLGGFIGVFTLFTSNGFLMPFLGVSFVISSISVIIQVLVYKLTKKRVFLMAPFHHHLQMKGYSEAKVSFIYSLLTVIIGSLLVISYS